MGDDMPNWADNVEIIATKVVQKILNGGNKCLKGKELEGKVTSVQAELTEEKNDRKNTDAVLFSKLDKINITIIIGTCLLIVSVIVTNYIFK